MEAKINNKTCSCLSLVASRKPQIFNIAVTKGFIFSCLFFYSIPVLSSKIATRHMWLYEITLIKTKLYKNFSF